MYVYLYGKATTGAKVAVRIAHQPYFYARLKNVDIPALEKKLSGLRIEQKGAPAEVVRWELVERELLGIREQFWKVYTNYPKAVPPLAKQIQEWGIECYEKDILFVHRFLRDMGIVPTTLVEAAGEFVQEDSSLRVPLFEAQAIKSISQESLSSWKILALDIETYAETKQINVLKNPILMVACHGIDEQGKEFRKVITWKRFLSPAEYVEFVPDETALLTRIRDSIIEYSPDIITGYFSDGFDFPYLKRRAEILGVRLNIGVDGSELVASDTFRKGEAMVEGMVHVDLFPFIRYIFGMTLKTDSFSLDTVAAELLGHHKHVVDISKLAYVWDHEPERLQEYCAYNLHDAFLTLQLCTKLLSDMLEFTRFVGVPMFDVIRMRFSRLVENYILKRAMEFSVIAPNKPSDYEAEQRRQESIEGAFVYEPTPGLYKNLAVFDFRSLYPTIISAHHIAPEGFRCSCCEHMPHVPGKEEYWFCTREKKFITTVLDELIALRAKVKKMARDAKARGEDTAIYDARSYTIKVLANSFYGYLGFFGARWYSIECAASTTAYARYYIKKTIDHAREQGFEVLYADTDSCFMLLGEKTREQAMGFMQSVNKTLPWQMELEFEGLYPQGIFVPTKGSEKGAKKKYALRDSAGNIKITGFEVVRRNWSLMAKEVQEKVLTLVLDDKKEIAVAYVKERVKELKKGNVSLSYLIIRTQITRDLSQYSAVGPHVAAAQQMVGRGDSVFPGTVVEYVIVKGSGLVRERVKLADEVKEGEYDAEYYLNNQIIPAVSSIFAVLGYQEDEIFAESSQKGLGEFL